MTTPEDRLTAAGYALPEAAAPVAAYLPARRAGGLLYISGQLPLVGGRIVTGTMGTPGGPSVEDAADAARAAGLMALAQAKAALDGHLSRIRGVVRLGGFVAATVDFADHPKVINGASDLMLTAFGDSGRHARAAVGCASLPLGALVEVEALFDVDQS